VSRSLKTFSAALFASLLITAVALPGVASAGVVKDVLDGVQRTVNGLLGNAASAPDRAAAPDTQAGQPPDYIPPAHGANQHGQGTGVVADLTPSDELPLPYEADGGDEEVVVGSSRGERVDGDYHGHVTILTLLGNELIEGADTSEGQSSDGPLGDVNAALADLCSSTGLCLAALDVASDTTDSSSTNSFSTADVDLNPGQALPVLALGAVESSGSISQSGGCRTATGSSSVADADVAGLITASVIDSTTTSTACRDGSQTQDNQSSVIGLGGTGLPLPATGCEDGTPDTVLSIPLLLDLVCNADDSSATGGTQLISPFGVREGLTAFVLAPLVKATTAASESRASAPRRGGDDGDDDDDNDGVPDDEDECPNRPGPASNDGCPDDGGDGDGDDNDQDGDGVPDGQDDCPTVPGPASNDGCPIDTDGDGVPDDEDACPTVPGPASNDGCPLGGGGVDTDGDGIPDSEDDCPTVPGPASNNGCPLGGATGGPDDLAFTGSDVLMLALIGFGVGGGGLGLMAMADRRRRLARVGRPA
jgi:hypothetical protein